MDIAVARPRASIAFGAPRRWYGAGPGRPVASLSRTGASAGVLSAGRRCRGRRPAGRRRSDPPARRLVGERIGEGNAGQLVRLTLVEHSPALARPALSPLGKASAQAPRASVRTTSWFDSERLRIGLH